MPKLQCKRTEDSKILIWDDSQTLAQKLAQDSTAGTLTFLKQMMNLGYKYVLAELGRPVIEKTKTANSVISQDGYQLPPDYLFMKLITFTTGGNKYTLVEEESAEAWEAITQVQVDGIPNRYFIKPRFGINGAEILLYPRPSASNDTIKMVYDATDKDLSQSKYTTGTVTLVGTDAVASAIVVGAGTTWIAAMEGRYFQNTDAGSDGMWYRVKTRNGNTSITLENVYMGTSQAGVAYQIAEIFNLPEEMQILPVYFALNIYWETKQNSKQAAKYYALFKTGLEEGKNRHATKSDSAVIRAKRFASKFMSALPANFPASFTD